jgi:putative transposase
VRYNYRLRPGAQAREALLAEWNRCRFLWNEAVHQQRTGKRPTFCRLSKMLTEARRQFVWLRDGSQVAQQQTLRTFALALTHSMEVKGRRRPTFKKKRAALPTLEYTARGFSVRDGQLRLPKGVSIPVVWSRPLASAPTSVRVYQDALGHWYASFVVHRETRAAPTVEGSIGIDWGITTTATTTNPLYDLPFAGHRKRCAAELAKAQRKLSRRRKRGQQAPSKGYREAKLQVAKLHKKASRQNTTTSRNWAKSIVDNHQLIGIEDFRPKFLSQSRMARKASDAAIGTAKRTLVEYGKRAGREVVLVPPAYTTMTCSKCGEIQARLGLGQRTFRCEDCGHTAHRDLNAAWTILATAECNRAGVDDVRHLRLHPPKVAVGGAI